MVRIFSCQNISDDWVVFLKNLRGVYGQLGTFGPFASVSPNGENKPMQFVVFYKKPLLLNSPGDISNAYAFLRRLDVFSKYSIVLIVCVESVSDDLGLPCRALYLLFGQNIF